MIRWLIPFGEGAMALERLHQKLTKENLWLYILCLLRDRQPLYAYEIKHRIAYSFGFEPATITVYVVLYKMEGEGLVVSSTDRGGTDNVVRRYYRMTELGAKTLEDGKALLRKTLDQLQPGESTPS